MHFNTLSNYPPGAAKDPAAPWNEVEPPEESFNVVVSYSLSREAEVFSQDYNDQEELNSPLQAYEQSYKTLEELLAFTKEAAQYFLQHQDFNLRSKLALQSILQSAVGWTTDASDAEQL